MATRPSVLLIDDGELDDVRAILEDLGTAFVHLRGGSVPTHVDPPAEVLVASSRRAVIARDWPPGDGIPPRPTKIAVVTEDSNTLRAMLRRMGFDLLVRRPVHPYALRLVLLRALYRGGEKRRESRFAIGYDVTFRMGLRRQHGVMGDLSTGGARLLCREVPPVGARLALQIPREVAGKKALSLRAKVIRVAESVQDDDQRAVAIAFERVSAAGKQRIREILREREQGPARLPREQAGRSKPGCGPAGGTASEATRVPLAGQGSEQERRKYDRVRYQGEVRSLDQEAGEALVGRDLSVGGMRIEAHPDIHVGDLVQLAIYAEPEEEPITVYAHAVRDEGGRGLGLKFELLKPRVASRLESLVARLPAVETLEEDEVAGMGSVVSRIIGTGHPPAET